MEEPLYRRSFAAGMAAALLAALVLAVIDVALSGTAGVGPVLGLWLLAGLGLGLGWGLFLGAGSASWGPKFFRRGLAHLAAHRPADLALTGAILAGLGCALVAVFVIGKLAVALVGNVERKSVGGLLLGVLVVAMVPIWAALAIPLYRVTRKLARAVPRTERVPATAVLLVGGAAAVAAMAAFFVLTRLDWRALRLGSLLALLALPLGTFALTPLCAGWAERRGAAAGIAALVGAAIALALPVVALRGAPSAAVSAAVLDRSWIGGRAVPVLRGFFDGDGDGESAFFGGPDCDDQNPAVRASAAEIPGNGVDDNCRGGDGKVVSSALAAADSQLAPAPQAAAPRAGAFAGNVLILFVDTLRADKLGYAGYRRDGKSLTPRLDAFAKDAVVLERAFAQAPNTPRSVPSFLASRYPSALRFEKDFVDYPTVTDDNDLLFEVLSAGGLATSAVTSHFYFCDQKLAPTQCTDFRRPKHSNVRQGVADWDNEGAVDIAPSNKDIAAPRIVPRAVAKLAQLAKDKRRFAMMVHLFEPHSTYVEHEGWPITERGTAGLEQKYDYEIAYTDGWIGKILDALDEHGLADDTAVVVIADHGEAFGVHSMAGQRMFFHGQTLYNELIAVPFLIKVPGVAPRAVDQVVQLIDLAPTLADLVGLTAPPSWQGRSLMPLLRGESLPPAPAYAELLPAPAWNHDARAMITGDGAFKVIFRKSDNRWEIYDLRKDPQETKDLSTSAPNAEALKQELTTWIESAGG